MNAYQTKTMERLFRDYAHENGRKSQSDAAETKKRITNEVYRRKVALELLEQDDWDSAEQTYKQFLGEWG